MAARAAVTAIPAGAPIITTGLVFLSQRASIPPVRWLGLSLVLLAVLTIFLLGRAPCARSCAPRAGP